MLPGLGELGRLVRVRGWWGQTIFEAQTGGGEKKGEARAVLSLDIWFRSLLQTIFTFPIWKL